MIRLSIDSLDDRFEDKQKKENSEKKPTCPVLFYRTVKVARCSSPAKHSTKVW